MANTPQSRKRVLQNAKANLRNKSIRSSYRTAIKRLLRALKDGKVEEAKGLMAVTESRVDRAAKRKVIHNGQANRLKSRLKARISAASAASVAA